MIFRTRYGYSGIPGTWYRFRNGQRMIEMRDGCDYVRKQYVWGLGYVDELVQLATNFGDNNLCDRFYYAVQDANYNVLGVTDAAGVLVERYEYTPYGQRTVYGHAIYAADFDGDGDVDLDDFSTLNQNWGTGDEFSEGDADDDRDVDLDDFNILKSDMSRGDFLNDPLITHPRLESYRWRKVLDTLSLCDIGHQSLLHDRETGWLDNRDRYLLPPLGRFNGPDRLNQNQPGGGYQDPSERPSSRP